MFTRIQINDIAKDRIQYRAVIDKTLSGMSKGITTREVIDGFYLTYRICLNGDPTDFYVSLDGGLYYWVKDASVLQRISKADLIAEYEKGACLDMDQ